MYVCVYVRSLSLGKEKEKEKEMEEVKVEVKAVERKAEEKGEVRQGNEWESEWEYVRVSEWVRECDEYMGELCMSECIRVRMSRCECMSECVSECVWVTCVWHWFKHGTIWNDVR